MGLGVGVGIGMSDTGQWSLFGDWPDSGIVAWRPEGGSVPRTPPWSVQDLTSSLCRAWQRTLDLCGSGRTQQTAHMTVTIKT